MDTLLQDLRHALRTLARSPGLSLAAVLTLGLGIGANTAMFGVVDRLFVRPPAHVVDPDRVVRIYVTTTTPPFGANTMPIGAYPRYADFRDHARSFVSVAAYGSRGLSLGVGPAAEGVAVRSEEHTSELQSQSNLVCRLLLEKKKYTILHTKHSLHILPVPSL